ADRRGGGRVRHRDRPRRQRLGAARRPRRARRPPGEPVIVPFSAPDSGTGPLTWGQLAIWEAIERTTPDDHYFNFGRILKVPGRAAPPGARGAPPRPPPPPGPAAPPPRPRRLPAAPAPRGERGTARPALQHRSGGTAHRAHRQTLRLRGRVAA